MKLNNVTVHSGWAKYTSSTFDNWCIQYELGPISEVLIHFIECLSNEVINSLIEDIGHSIDGEEGFRKLEINAYRDKNTLHEWPLS